MRLSPLIATVSWCLASGLAAAADLGPMRGAPPVLADMGRADWNGFYVGAHGGGGWAKSYGSLSVTSATMAALPGVIPTIDSAATGMHFSGGAFGGLQIGYNWQVGTNLVAGVEGDFSFSSLHGSRTSGGIVPVFGSLFGFNQRIANPFASTLRARVGFTPFASMLVYGTGGLAFGRVRYDSDFWDAANEVEAYRSAAWRVGWTLGGGVEVALGRGWSAKIEYLHTELPGISGVGASLLIDGTYALTQHNSGRLASDTLRAGVNYRFGQVAPAVWTK